MIELLKILAPELVLIAAACVLFLLGCARSASARRSAAALTMLALVAALFVQVSYGPDGGTTIDSLTRSIRLDALSSYIIVISCIVGVLLLLLSWPGDAEATGNSALRFGWDAGEYYALFLLSIAGLFLVAISNDLIVFFLALELVSIPTYIMVSISRPAMASQEAGLKYFFLGAMSVALMLFGFSYIYGTTGAVNFPEISAALRRGVTDDQVPLLASWQKLGVLFVLVGLAYKMAAFPLHFYAGDVYEGAGTPVTAFLAYVPKAAGFVAVIRVLALVGGEQWMLPAWLAQLLWIIAALTMTIGNVLGLLQSNIKRVLAYSSIAHSGYMLVGLAAISSSTSNVSLNAIQGVLFYLAVYGVMNTAAFGVLMLLPSRFGSGSAETFDELSGQGRRHVALALAMTIACLSLIGIPLTAGFLGKVMLIRPALQGGLIWLTVILVVNAAISAAYYLRIVGTLFLRPRMGMMRAADEQAEVGAAPWRQKAVASAVIASAVLTMGFGTIPPAAQMLAEYAGDGARLSAPETAAEPIPPTTRRTTKKPSKPPVKAGKAPSSTRQSSVPRNPN